MASSRSKSFVKYLNLVLALSILATLTSATRHFNKRSDLENVPPVAESGYTVPLESGGQSCANQGQCITFLPSPSPNMKLVALTIARGTMTFNCTDSSPSTLPFYTGQTTELYDVAPLIQYFPSEETLHQLVTQFYNYDYAQLKNSSLICIGSIFQEDDGPAVVELSGFQTFQVTAKVELNAADFSDGQWVQSASGDGAWEVYRVETRGGALPAGCEGQVQVMGSAAYAAEYWFYHS